MPSGWRHCMKSSLRNGYGSLREELGRGWKGKCERAAAAGMAFDRNIAAMCAHNTARDRQAKPGPARLPAARFFAPVETFEDLRKVVGLNAFAGVDDGN